tara:strand:+ start:43390 stop:44103 length:714 start_codon:yes stop_codon:yes gene_type:complete
MNLKTYTNLISYSQNIKEEHISELKKIIKNYPYFQSARALYLKGLKNQDSFRYNNELKITAAFTADRSILFDFITSISFDKTSNIHQEIRKKISSQNISTIEKNIKTIEKELDLGTPITFSKNETHSFQQWLQISINNPIERNSLHIESDDNNFLINRFIEKNPKITSLKKHDQKTISISKNKSDTSLMTETLAKVYLEQKKFSNAIKAYEILSLKYPEKSGFFADQIKKIKILQKQ